MLQAFRSKQFLAFLLTGGCAALLNFGLRIVLSHWFNFALAVLLAYLGGMLCAFVLAKLWVFAPSQHSLRRSALLFALVNLAAIAQTWVISMLLAFWLLPALGVQHYAAEIAHAVGIAVPVFSSYLGHKRWSFQART